MFESIPLKAKIKFYFTVEQLHRVSIIYNYFYFSQFRLKQVTIFDSTKDKIPFTRAYSEK